MYRKLPLNKLQSPKTHEHAMSIADSILNIKHVFFQILIVLIFQFQVTIHEDSMSIADSIFSMRVANALPPNSGMNGRHSRQSSLSIQSASGIRASPTIGLSMCF